jgi:hypothetical protein
VGATGRHSTGGVRPSGTSMSWSRHGAVAECLEVAARLAADHAYIDALRRKEQQVDARLGQVWLSGAHQRNLEQAQLGGGSRAQVAETNFTAISGEKKGDPRCPVDWWPAQIETRGILRHFTAKRPCHSVPHGLPRRQRADGRCFP